MYSHSFKTLIFVLLSMLFLGGGGGFKPPSPPPPHKTSRHVYIISIFFSMMPKRPDCIYQPSSDKQHLIFSTSLSLLFFSALDFLLKLFRNTNSHFMDILFGSWWNIAGNECFLVPGNITQFLFKAFHEIFLEPPIFNIRGCWILNPGHCQSCNDGCNKNSC